MDTSLDWRDFEEIKRLRARYFRCVDTHDWAGLRELLDDDLHFYFGHGKVPNYTQADAFVSAVRASAKGGVTVHQGHMPEIEFIDTLNAKGVWAMEDWVDNGTLGFAYRGFGHYHETYRRRAVGQPWLIASSRLTRLRVTNVEPSDPDALAANLDAYYSARTGGLDSDKLSNDAQVRPPGGHQ